MTSNSYELEPGWAPNPVFDAACAYLVAAEEVFLKESERDAQQWLYVPNWFVSHHLSVIATELFLKSFKVTFSYDTMDENGPIGERYAHAFEGHKADLNKLPVRVSSGLEAHLPDKLFDLMKTLSNLEISRGRYPYEWEKKAEVDPGFPQATLGASLQLIGCYLLKNSKGTGNLENPLFRTDQLNRKQSSLRPQPCFSFANSALCAQPTSDQLPRKGRRWSPQWSRVTRSPPTGRL